MENTQKHKQYWLISIIAVFLITLLGGYYLLMGGNMDKADLTDDWKNDPPLRILYSPWPPDTINYLAQEKGFFDKHKVNVELVWVEGYEGLFENIENGTADLWNLTLLDAVKAFSEGDDWQVVLVQDYSVGADAVVSLPDNKITDIAGLKGKKIGMESETIGEFFLAILLKKENLTFDDITIVEVASEDVQSALKEGTIDAGVCYEPCPTEVLADNGLIIVDSAKERGVIVDIYSGKKSKIEKNKEQYIRAISAIVEAGEYFNKYPEEAAKIIKEPLEMSDKEILETFNKIKIADLRENLIAFNRSAGFESAHTSAKLAQQYLEDQGAIDTSVDPDELFSDIIYEVEKRLKIQ